VTLLSAVAIGSRKYTVLVSARVIHTCEPLPSAIHSPSARSSVAMADGRGVVGKPFAIVGIREKGSVESTHKVPTSHYHETLPLAKGSVESTHKVP
jgi:hypothetical protein